jgi:hypothetical protein
MVANRMQESNAQPGPESFDDTIPIRRPGGREKQIVGLAGVVDGRTFARAPYSGCHIDEAGSPKQLAFLKLVGVKMDGRIGQRQTEILKHGAQHQAASDSALVKYSDGWLSLPDEGRKAAPCVSAVQTARRAPSEAPNGNGRSIAVEAYGLLYADPQGVQRFVWHSIPFAVVWIEPVRARRRS